MKATENHTGGEHGGLRGLSADEARARLHKFGPNVIIGQQGRSALAILVHQLKSPLMLLLAVAALLSYGFREWLDGSAVMIVLIVNVGIGFWMELQAKRSMNALKRMVSLPAKVLREGRITEIPSEEVVPSDILYVSAGDLVAGEAHLIEANDLQTDESALTGESMPVTKYPGQPNKEVQSADRKHLLLKGTYVTRGNGYARVLSTGMQTEMGRIAALVSDTGENATPLEKKLQVFSRRLIWITIGLLAAILLVGLFQKTDLLELVKTAIALAVAAIPEGLPIVATLALARGMLRLAKHHVLIKRLAAVETLGGTDVICTDKTGTLTRNRIEVHMVLVPGDGEQRVVRYHSGDDMPVGAALTQLLEISVLCSTAGIRDHEDDEARYLGDPIETSLLRFASQSGMQIEILRAESPQEGQLPFSSESKMMLTMHRREGMDWVAAKGALEEILSHCTAISQEGGQKEMDAGTRRFWLEQGEQLARRGLRVLGFAWKAGLLNSDNLVFSGIVAFLDPPVEGVKAALDECRQAGIEVKMITGDHPDTARTIAAELNLSDPAHDMVILGREMKPVGELTPEDRATWNDTRIFARVSPEQKYALISVLQESGHRVAMTGDGINDAPALRKADIGIAMGKRGTQVAQEVADMVLRDDRFVSIVHAIRYGRIIFENIRKFVVYLLSGNLSELMAVAAAAFLNLQFQLFPLQILFINLVSDVLPALALGMSKGSGEVMRHPPRNPAEPLIQKRKWTAIWIYAGVMAGCTLGGVWIHHHVLHTGEPWDPQTSNNLMFLSLIGSQFLHVFNMDTGTRFFGGEEFRNVYVWWAFALNAIMIALVFNIPDAVLALHLTELTFQDIGVIVGVSVTAFVLNRCLKTFGKL